LIALRRRAKDAAFTAAAALAALVALAPLASVTWYVVSRGAPAISWSFLTSLPTSPDDPASGIGPAIVGTLVLVALAAAVGVPVGVAAGVWLAEFGRNRAGRAFTVLVDVLAAVPSIVTGIFVFTVVVLAQGHFSALAGGLALALMVVPVVTRTTQVALLAVPNPLREAGVALGATYARTLARVVLPSGKRGIATGAILAMARVAGETAPLLFTALYAQFWAESLDEPIAALPTLIYNYIQQPYESLQAQAWGAAFLLFVLVFGANLLVRLVVLRRDHKA
jgi:phosphate transport system permease protein